MRFKDGRYLSVNVFNGKKFKKMSVHRLMLITFVGPKPKNCQCRHLDDVPTNNKISNLCWGTPKQNAEDRDRNGGTARGERAGLAKLCNDEVLKIRKLRYILTYAEIAKKFNVTESNIKMIMHRSTWKEI